MDPRHGDRKIEGTIRRSTVALLMSLATRRKTPSKCRLQLRRDGTIYTSSLKNNEFHAKNTISDNIFVEFCKRSDVHDEANLTSDRPTTLPKSLRYDVGWLGNVLCDDFGRHAGAKCADLKLLERSLEHLGAIWRDLRAYLGVVWCYEKVKLLPFETQNAYHI